jgi:3-hydroxybutyrate dehydrogenase
MKTRGLTRDQVINDVLLASTPQKQFVMPEQVAATLVFLCSEAAKAITGANIPIDGGWTAQ